MMATMQWTHGARDPKPRTIPYSDVKQMDGEASLNMVGAAMAGLTGGYSGPPHVR